MSAVIDGTERIRLNPRITTDGTAYILDTDSLLSSSGSIISIRNQGNEIFRIDSSGVSINEGDILATTNQVDGFSAIEAHEFDSLNIKGYAIRFNESDGVYEFETAKSGVVWQGALEDLVMFYNNTGSTIADDAPPNRVPYPDIPRITLSDAKAAFDLNNAVFIDTRGDSYFSQGHIPGALSITEDQIGDRIDELDSTAWIITYCT